MICSRGRKSDNMDSTGVGVRGVWEREKREKKERRKRERRAEQQK